LAPWNEACAGGPPPAPYDWDSLVELVTSTWRKTVTIDETINKLIDLKLHTLAKSLREMLEMPPDKLLTFEDRLGLLAYSA
jgi:hypothetical protein